MKSRVMIVDDHPIFRMGMAELLNQEEDFIVCGLAEDISTAEKVIEETQPELAIVDITLAGDNGLELESAPERDVLGEAEPGEDRDPDQQEQAGAHRVHAAAVLAGRARVAGLVVPGH